MFGVLEHSRENLMINSLSKFVIALSIVLLAGGIEAAAQTHTPAVPPAPDCKPTNGSGTWVKGDIIPSSKSPSMGAACTQVYNCVVKPDKKPNEACKFTLKHTDAKNVSGRCDSPACKNCADSPPTAKCEWSYAK
jgi:hypothetical protein